MIYGLEVMHITAIYYSHAGQEEYFRPARII